MLQANPMQLTPRDPDSGLVRVVIDTPAGSRNKYKFDPQLRIFKISRILPAGLSFPFDFGSIPGTHAEDGDALDVLVLTEAPLVVGCLVHVRLIGVIRATQKEGRKSIRNDRLVGSIQTSVNPARFRELSEVSRDLLREIEHFFRSYNEAQGRQFRITGRGGAQAAERILKRAIGSDAAGRP
ncbi:MAG TPA: inorganic diphosphatase [Steroidobacteraceae bacterium]|jgi:inorganic pyrophosphatase